MSTPKPTEVASRATDGLGDLPLISILVVQLFVGYEWFDSGLTKVVDGGFPAGLAADLHDRVKSAAGWYGGRAARDSADLHRTQRRSLAITPPGGTDTGGGATAASPRLRP